MFRSDRTAAALAGTEAMRPPLLQVLAASASDVVWTGYLVVSLPWPLSLCSPKYCTISWAWTGHAQSCSFATPPSPAFPLHCALGGRATVAGICQPSPPLPLCSSRPSRLRSVPPVCHPSSLYPPPCTPRHIPTSTPLHAAMVGWASPAGMPAYTCLTPAVVNLLQATPLMRETTRRRDLVGVPVGAWDDSEIHVLGEAVFSSALLAADASASGTEVLQSTIHGRGVFATRDMRPGERILPFTGQLVYDDLEACALSARWSGITYVSPRIPRHMRCTAKSWLSRAIELDMDADLWDAPADVVCPTRVPEAICTKACVRTYEGPTRSVWIAPAEFCAAGFVNDYRPGREVNAQFEQAHDPLMTAEQLLVPGAAHILVLTDVKAGEEIVVDYGSSYCSL